MDCSALGGLLPQIVTGRLSAAASDRLVEHLLGCPRCSERVDRARAGLRTPTDKVPAFETAPIRSSDEEIIPTQASVSPGGTLKYGSDTGRVDSEPGPGTKIGSYIIIDEIARGGMGIVYRANQKHMNRVVALKTLPRAALDDEELVLRFIREARAAAELNHPNVVRVYDIGRDMGLIWYSMELVEGRSLKDLIRSDGRLAPRKAVDVAIGCARALEAAEAHGIVHRDVKPDNLLVTEDGGVKLADLGLVRHEMNRGAADLTRAGDVLGTPAYMSPEQARDSRHADNRSDLWSLGATLYHALFGVPPFVARTAMETVSRVLQEEVRYPAELDALPRELRATLKKLLQKKPSERFQTASEVVKALERCRVEIDQRRSSQRLGTGSEARRILAANPKIHRATSSAEHPAARPRRRRGARRARLLPLAAVLGAAGIAGSFLVIANRKRPEAPVDASVATTATSGVASPAPVASARQVAARPDSERPRPPVREELPDPGDQPPPVEPALPNGGVPVEVVPASASHGASHATALAELKALLGASSIADLVAAVARADALVGEEPEAASVRDALADRLAKVEEARRELDVEEAVAKALEGVRRFEPNGFEAARQACTHTIARLDSRVAVELTDAATRSEELIARGRKGLPLDVPEPFALKKNGVTISGSCQAEGDLWRSGSVYFRFPADVTTDGLRTLAGRVDRSPVSPRAAAAWALLTNDLNDARKRLIAIAKSEKEPIYERLQEVLWAREHNLRVPVLVHADMAWSVGQRAVAQQLYARVAGATPDVLAADERARALERSGLVKPAPAPVAPGAAKRSWDFKVKERTDGLPAEWTQHPAVNFDFVAPERRHMAARLQQFDVEQTPNGLELTGVGRIVAAPSWTQAELAIELEAELPESMGVGLTLGDVEGVAEPLWVVAGYGVRYAPRDRTTRTDFATLAGRSDGLWFTTSGFPQLVPWKGVEVKPVDEPRPGHLSLRLAAKRASDGKVRLSFAHVVDGKLLTIAEGVLSEHLPARGAALHAGLVVTGWGDTETATIERFSVTPR